MRQAVWVSPLWDDQRRVYSEDTFLVKSGTNTLGIIYLKRGGLIRVFDHITNTDDIHDTLKEAVQQLIRAYELEV